MAEISSAKKVKAIKLRLQGNSYREISAELTIAKSTLNGWLKNINLTSAQKQKLYNQWLNGLVKARSVASERNKQAKLNRIQAGQVEAKKMLESLSLNDAELELFLAGLYLGEGYKTQGRLGLGNTNPNIMLLFITLMRKLYEIKEERIRAAIYARADQNVDSLVTYWSNLLNIPRNQFHKTQLDQRTKGIPTRANYKGVCGVSYNSSSIQRRIVAISEEVIKYINNAHQGSVAHLARARH